MTAGPWYPVSTSGWSCWRTITHGQTTYYLRSREPSASCHTTESSTARRTSTLAHPPALSRQVSSRLPAAVRPRARSSSPDRPLRPPPPQAPARRASRGQWTAQCTLGTVAAQRRPRMQEHAQVAGVDHGCRRVGSGRSRLQTITEYREQALPGGGRRSHGLWAQPSTAPPQARTEPQSHRAQGAAEAARGRARAHLKS